MTETQKQKLIQRYKEHLKLFGYPEIHPSVVFQELPTLWEIAQSEHVVPAGMSYQYFRTIAEQSFFKYFELTLP